MAEDIVQNAFIRLVQKIHQFDNTRPFAPWSLRCVINDAIKAAGRQKRQVSLDSAELSQSIALIDSLADPQPGPEDQFIDAERCQEVWQAIHRLPPEQRAAIVQRYYLGYSEADMSAHMQCPAGTVKWLLHTARHKLRFFLAAYTMPPETEILSEYAEYKED